MSAQRGVSAHMGIPACSSGYCDEGVAEPPSCHASSDAQETEPSAQILVRLDRIAVALEDLVEQSHRLANHLVPIPGSIVDSPFVASLLGCTVTWVSEMARSGKIPKGCIVPGTGNGKLWKFYRERVEEWVNKR